MVSPFLLVLSSVLLLSHVAVHIVDAARHHNLLYPVVLFEGRHNHHLQMLLCAEQLSVGALRACYDDRTGPRAQHTSSETVRFRSK